MRIALTANGPGEVAGWVRPLLRRLYERQPQIDVHLFLVPDDYASGFEATMARGLFPQAHVYDPKTYLRVAFGGSTPELPKSVDLVLYVGGDLMHAMRLHKRLGGAVASYKFSKPRYRERIARVFAVDAKNVEQLRGWGIPDERIVRVGNLAIDGALLEAQAAPEVGTPREGILIMPGSRPHEIANLVPFFFTTALCILREAPQVPIAFGISPFTPNAQLRAAIEAGADPRMWSQRGRLVEEGDRVYLASLDGAVRIPVVRSALAAAKQARLVLTLPGTKCIELAAIGAPMVTITPMNAPELITVNGPLTYLDRIPLVGVPLKRAAVVAVGRRFPLHTQPNIDTGEMLIEELHGTLTPGRVARVVLERFNDSAWLDDRRTRLAQLYRDHVGASDRMAESVLALAGS